MWPRAENAIQREAIRLAEMGLISGTKEYTGTRGRTEYAITDEGRAALREWLGTPVTPYSMDDEAILRVHVASLGTKDELIGTLKQVLAETEAWDDLQRSDERKLARSTRCARFPSTSPTAH